MESDMGWWLALGGFAVLALLAYVALIEQVDGE